MPRTAAVLDFTLLVSVSVLAPAVSRAEFERIVDFSITLKSLSVAAEGNASLSTARLAMLDGTVSEVTILDKEQETFRARIELISGEWFGLDDVKSYACYVEFAGPEFFKVFPAKAPRNPGPNVIVQNTRVVVVARPLQVIKTPLGEKQVLAEGLLIRAVR